MTASNGNALRLTASLQKFGHPAPAGHRCKRRSTANAAHGQSMKNLRLSALDPSAATHPRLSWVGAATELGYELGPWRLSWGMSWVGPATELGYELGSPRD